MAEVASPRALIKPELLSWARSSAGYRVEDAAAKAAVKPEKLIAWEAGEKQPTMNQLRKLARIYRRSISTFYLPRPPRDFEPMHDFRRLPGEVALTYSPQLRMEIRAAYQRRELALSLTEELGQKPKAFKVRATINENAEDVAARARSALRVSYEEQSRWRDGRKAYNAWRQKIEALGVLVFQAVGVTTTEMRGFSVAEDLFPIIAVNVKDAPGGRIFSLLHEFTHLMLKESSLCDFEEGALRPAAEDRVEIFCNHVAGAILVPRNHLLSEPVVSEKGSAPAIWQDGEIKGLARKYGVSREVILRRLLIFGRLSPQFYQAKRQELLTEYASVAVDREGVEFKRNLPQEAVSNFGRQFTRLVLDTYSQDRIALSDVAKYLGVRARHVPTVRAMIDA